MKFLIIIIVLFLIYFISKLKRESKEKTNNINNMILCKKCGFHVPHSNICTSNDDDYICPKCK